MTKSKPGKFVNNLFKDNILYKVLLIVIIKIVFLFLFTSEYSFKLFQPFVNVFVKGHLNPWQYYYANGLDLNSFPYHGLMLYILSVPAVVVNILNISNPFISNFIFKLPLLIADLSLFYALLKLFPAKQKKVFGFYFINPIIIYAIYVHGQLDIIPMAFFVWGIYFLSIAELKYSYFFVGLSIATKHHILLALPLLLFYLLKKYDLMEVIICACFAIGTPLIADAPFILSNGFFHMVILNPKQSLFFDSYYKIGNVKLLLPIASILLVYFHFFNQERVNHDLLFFYFGMLFAVAIMLIYPSPAWYIWLVPFVSMYFIQSKSDYKSSLLNFIFALTYLIFFIFFSNSGYKDIIFLGKVVNIKVPNTQLANLSYTILVSLLLTIMYAFYKYGIRSNSIYKRQSNLTIGIGGGSGAGKTFLLNNITSLFGDRLLKIEGDGDHKWERGDSNWEKHTHLDPKANFIHKQAEAFFELKNNRPIYRSEYNHDTGKFTKQVKLEPKEFIAISGLHPFYLPKLRKALDLKIYVDTDEKLRKHWKILRDTKIRNSSKDNVVKQIGDRLQDFNKYIQPQKDFADLVIKYFPISKIDLGKENQKPELGLKITIDANIHLKPLLERIDVDYIWDYNDDIKTQFIELKKEPSFNYEALALEMISGLLEIISRKSEWLTGYDGLIQLIILIMVSEKLKESET